MQHINLIQHGVLQSLQGACSGEVVQENLLDLLRTHIGVTGNLTRRVHNVNQRHLITCTHARNRLYAYRNTQLMLRLHHRFIYLGRTAHLTAVLHTQTHFAYICNLAILVIGTLGGRLQELLVLLQHGLHSTWLHVAIYLLVNLHYGSQCAASQTGNLLDRIFAIGRGYAILGNIQFTAECIIHSSCTLNVAGSTDADLDGVLTVGYEFELRVERSHADKVGACNLRALIYSLQSIRGKIRKLLLQSLQQRDGHLTRATHTLDDGIDTLGYGTTLVINII